MGFQAEVAVSDHVSGFDVCVVGGGMSGLCAAIAASREGARTILVHNRPVLGGNASTEIRVPLYGAGHHNPSANETGIILELLTEERARSHDYAGSGMVNAQWDIILYNAVRREANLRVLLNTHVFDVNVEQDSVRSVVGLQQGTERIWEIAATFFIDCSGDGAVGSAAGVPFRIGQEARSEYGEGLAPEEEWNWTLGSSLFFRARDIGQPVPFSPPSWAERYPDEESLLHRDHRRVGNGYWWIEIGFPYDTIRENEEIRDELLRHVLGVWDHIKNHCVGKEAAANYALDWVGMVPAKRESRRFIGAHVMTQQEIQQRVQYPDRVAYGGWIIDDHTKGGILERTKGPNPHGTTGLTPYLVVPYSVPLGSLYARELQNLFFAGRLVSASRLVFNSLRVQRTLAVIGQAAGTAASHSSRTGRNPAAFKADDIQSVQQSLLRQDCYIPGIRNEDPDDVARDARVRASSAMALIARPKENGMALDKELSQILPASERPERVRVHVKNGSADERELYGSLYVARDIWDLVALEREACASVVLRVPPSHEGPVEGDVRGKLKGRALYWLRIGSVPDVTLLFQADVLPGVTAARHDGKAWVFAPRTLPLAVDIMPTSRPFEPENIVNGVARPESWPNVWVSQDGLPQWCRIELAAPVELDRIQVAWGLDFSRTYLQMSPFFRAPECARDYHIEVNLPGGRSVTWTNVRGNYQRLRIHERPKAFSGKVSAIHITVEATNGAPRVEIDEVRAYRAK